MSLLMSNVKHQGGTWAAEAALTLSPCFYGDPLHHHYHHLLPNNKQTERATKCTHTLTYTRHQQPIRHTCHGRLMRKYILHRRHDNRIISHPSDPRHIPFVCMCVRAPAHTHLLVCWQVVCTVCALRDSASHKFPYDEPRGRLDCKGESRAGRLKTAFHNVENVEHVSLWWSVTEHTVPIVNGDQH